MTAVLRGRGHDPGELPAEGRCAARGLVVVDRLRDTPIGQSFALGSGSLGTPASLAPHEFGNQSEVCNGIDQIPFLALAPEPY